MHVYITYEVNNIEALPLILRKLKQLNYSDIWEANGLRYTLPNFGVWKANTDMSDAYADFFNIITNCKKEFDLEVLSCMVVSANPWMGMPDKTNDKRKNATDLELLAKMKRKTEDLLLENNSEKVEELDNLIGNWIAELKNKT